MSLGSFKNPTKWRRTIRRDKIYHVALPSLGEGECTNLEKGGFIPN